ncbi:hypothetical protein CM15mP35_10470 [bacterium]|nr:MAG: hypothetical protein CM15mP35_10470 [bacterium]
MGQNFYILVDGIFVGGSKLVIQNDKLKDLKIENLYHFWICRSIKEVDNIYYRFTYRINNCSKNTREKYNRESK